MKILIVSQYFWPENFRVNDLALELAKLGHEITVLTGEPNYPIGKIFPDYVHNPAKFMSYQSVKIVRVPIISQGSNGIMRILNYLSYALNASILGAFRLQREKFDTVFVFQNSPATVGFPAVFLSKLKNAPLAIWVLDQWPETLEAVGVVKSKRILRYLGILITALYKRCDLILVQSESLVKLIKEKYSENAGRVHYFPNWAETIFNNTVELAAPEITYKKDFFNVMFAGNIGDSQDFPSIIDAAEKLAKHSKIRWLIVGDGNKYKWLKDEVERRNLESNVILLGSYPVERMPSFYKHANALLVSLRSEPIFSMTLPGKIQSYFAAGIPVIGMLDGEGSYVINDAEAGISCPAGDSDALAAAVLKMSKMKKVDLDIYGHNGLLYSKNIFNRETQIKTLEKYLLKLSVDNYRI